MLIWSGWGSYDLLSLVVPSIGSNRIVITVASLCCLLKRRLIVSILLARISSSKGYLITIWSLKHEVLVAARLTGLESREALGEIAIGDITDVRINELLKRVLSSISCFLVMLFSALIGLCTV